MQKARWEACARAHDREMREKKRKKATQNKALGITRAGPSNSRHGERAAMESNSQNRNSQERSIFDRVRACELFKRRTRSLPETQLPTSTSLTRVEQGGRLVESETIQNRIAREESGPLERFPMVLTRELDALDLPPPYELAVTPPPPYDCLDLETQFRF